MPARHDRVLFRKYVFGMYARYVHMSILIRILLLIGMTLGCLIIAGMIALWFLAYWAMEA
jgi:hypothetical protein